MKGNGTTAAAFVFLLIGAVLTPAAHGDEGEIVVTATGAVSTAPDRIHFQVDIQSVEKTAAAATQATAVKYKAVQDALRAVGIPLEDAPTLGFLVMQAWERDDRGHQTKPIGFEAKHSIELRLRDMERIGPAVDAVVATGAHHVWRFDFATLAYDSLRQVALERAVKRARVDAEAMARAAGGHLGSLVELTTSEAIVAMGGRLSHDPEATALKVGIPTTMQPAQEVVRVTVLGRWRFEKIE